MTDPGARRSDAIDADGVVTGRYLGLIGVRPLSPATSPFDPGYDLGTLQGHLAQSAHLMAIVKISMACWIIANETVTRAKVASVAGHGVPTVSGGGPFEVAAVQGRLAEYLDMCADIGFTRIEAGQGFTNTDLDPARVVAMAHARDLQVQYELGGKHDGAFSEEVVTDLLGTGRRWLDAGAVELVIEARENAAGVGLFGETGTFNGQLADRFAQEFSLRQVMFEAPTKPSQFALLDHFGPEVRLCNVRLEELLRVEIYRRGLHSDAFRNPILAPTTPLEVEGGAERVEVPA